MSTITSSISAITAPNKATEVDASSPASISAFVNSQELYSAQVSDNLVPDINTVIGEINVVKGEMVTHEANVSADAIIASDSADISIIKASEASASETISTTKASEASASAAAALLSEQTAQSLIDDISVAPLWVSGTDYQQYQITTDPTNFKTYKTKIEILNSIDEPHTSSEWEDVSGGSTASFNNVEFVATAGQDTFVVGYQVENLYVTRQGLRLGSSEYVATNGTSVVLNVPATLDDLVVISVYNSFDIANTYTKQETDNLITGVTPIGGIIMYSGILANIPSNWSLCDGTLGTPNLVDRFVLGTNIEGDIGNVGGTLESTMPSHSHTADHSHTASSNSTGAHTHTEKYRQVTPSSAAAGSNYNVPHSSPTTYSTGSAGTHSHSITVNSASVTTSLAEVAGDNRPPFITLAYIIRVS